ncbi:polysaccharide deacetylase family protein [Paenibacillus sp. NPDC057967]|uniref:polysaccharide deacetylase family protein n=1 Tax=Paenibacillus sp. NPDC057967 TaxID=3346293 RepID=UPI0036D7996E
MIFTVDLEDWFCSPELSLADWKRYPFRLEKPTHLLLDMLDEKNAKGTFFVLGWIAEHKPELVKEIHRRGHEIASHGYAHRLVYKQSRLEFKEDIRHSKSLLEQLTGSEVRGYRAPCFSMTEWGLELLEEEGFNYDSSLMPNSFGGDSGGLSGYPNSGSSFRIKGRLTEYPLPAHRIGSLRIPWGGGGYYRLYPYEVFRYGVTSWLKGHDYFLFYIHPYDLDKEQPRIFQSTWSNSFRRYYGLGGTHRKIERMLSDFDCTSIEHYEHQAVGMVLHG